MKDGATTWHFDQLKPAKCAPGEAIYGASPPYSERGAPPENVSFMPSCCPLPASDILLDEHLTATPNCPQGYVATGTPALGLCRNCPFELRCSKINSDRYRLSEQQPGRYWGTGFRFWHEENRLMRLNIPAAIRYGLGRTGPYSWDFQGCVGYPFGSLLTGKDHKSCAGVLFRRLEYNGLAGDPPAGTPVVMFPECDDISDEVDPNARCIRNVPPRSE